MKRIAAGTLLASVLALAVGACDSRSQDAYGYDNGSGPAGVDCAAYASCAACTPVVGCGWCSTAGGSGACTAGPDQCTGSAFSWTWDPGGCRVGADASVGNDAALPLGDAGDAGASDSGPRDTGASDAAQDATPVDAARDAASD